MPIQYTMIPDLKLVYVYASGSITGHDILAEGARMFQEQKWSNGFSILCDYRDIQQFNVDYDGILNIVSQDKQHEALFDQSKFAILTGTDVTYGIARMWTSLSVHTQIHSRIFKTLEDSLEWMNVDHLSFQTVVGSP